MLQGRLHNWCTLIGRTMNTPVRVLSVLIPAFNEEQTIIPVLRKVLALGPVLKEVIVVDDGSRDRTPELVDRKSTRLNSSHSQISYAVFCLNKKSHNYQKHRPSDT